ncbi:MAG: alpha/beta hydrolase [Myxococcales bacterium]|nr:alpha/beta hydrolase [Myxococcales bacterium]
MAAPASHSYFSQRLRLHYVDWGNPDRPTLLLVHGGRDHCRNWDWVAEAFRDEYHVIAPDLRGHGDSQWSLGSGYALVDYVYDIAQLVHQLRLSPLNIIGHSLGGHVSTVFAGVYPERVQRFISIEGFGPSPDMLAKRATRPPEARLSQWVEQARELAGRAPRRYARLEDAIERMREANPHLSLEQARHLTVHGANQNEDGSFSWKFDNYVRVGTPHMFSPADLQALRSRISCPTLLIRGEDSWVGDPEKDGRLAHFRDARVARVPKAGHWVHHDQLDAFVALAWAFLRE